MLQSIAGSAHGWCCIFMHPTHYSRSLVVSLRQSDCFQSSILWLLVLPHFTRGHSSLQWMVTTWLAYWRPRTCGAVTQPATLILRISLPNCAGLQKHKIAGLALEVRMQGQLSSPMLNGWSTFASQRTTSCLPTAPDQQCLPKRNPSRFLMLIAPGSRTWWG